ncbi:MFS transporter [Streptomyces sp. NPDC007971]|uniref:MFS transporter n=1 Tax=Streptomyces sp. NPDC007971 TaxID=3364799 RepID=UPI0036EF0108
MTVLTEAPDTRSGSGAPAGRRSLITGALLALFLAAADSTVVGSILPTMARSLGQDELYPWLVSGFLLCSILATAVSGAAADRFGSRTAMCAALLLFAAGSAASAVAPGMVVLIAARALQGLGAGAVITLAYVLVGQVFDAAGRAKMQGLLSAIWGLAAVAGPALGSAAQATVGWRWVFAVNLPLALAAALVVARKAPAGTVDGSERPKLDGRALATFSVGLTALLIVVVSPEPVLLVIAAVIAAVTVTLHIRRVRRTPEASLIPVAMVTDRVPRAAALVSLLASVLLYASVTQLPLALTRTGAAGATASGLVVLVASLGWVAGSAVCAGLLGRFGGRTVATIGGVLLAIGAAVLCLPTEPSLPAAIAGQLLAGLGTGFTVATALVQAQNAAPAEQLGAYTGAVTLCRNIGAAVGVNLIASIQHGAEEDLGGADARVTSYRLAFGVLVAVGLLALPAARRLKSAATEAADD